MKRLVVTCLIAAGLAVAGTSGSTSAGEPVGGPLVASHAAIDFGQVVVGETSAPTAVAITNTDSTPFGPIAMSGGAAGLFGGAQDCQGQTLAADGGTCYVSYAYSPTGPGVDTFTTSFTIEIAGDPDTSQTFAVVLTGEGINPPAAPDPLVASRTAIDFGQVVVGEISPPVPVVVTNTGSTPFGPIFTDFVAPPFGVYAGCQGATLTANGGTCEFTYSYHPMSIGLAATDASFTVEVNGDPSTRQTFPLSLTGEGIRAMSASPTSIDFGQVLVGATSAPVSVVFTNASNAPFGPIPLVEHAVEAPFLVEETNCVGATLAPSGGTCAMTLTYSPTSPGAETTDTWVTLDGEGGDIAFEFILILAGEGIEAAPTTSAPGDTTSTTAAPSDTTSTVAQATPVTTVPPGELPATGSGTTPAVVAFGLLLVGTFIFGAARRRPRTAE